MKLLFETTDVNELNALRILMESNGIVVHVGNEDSARNASIMSRLTKYAIFIVYEQQYPDALALLDNEEHVVEHTIDIEEYQRMQDEHKSAVLTKIFKTVMSITALLLIFCFGLVWLMETLDG